MLDKLDKEILKEVARLPHQASISEIERSFKGKRAHSSLYERIKGLAALDLIRTDKQKHYVFVEITEKGQMEAQSKEDRTS